MIKWALAGILYVTVVILGFEAYDKWFAEDENTAAQTENHSNQEMKMDNGHDETGESGQSGGHAHEFASGTTHDGSEVNAFVLNDQDNIKIFLKDKAGNPVDELEVNHEKELHLIIVDEQLQKYYHIHPERTGKGEYTIENNLPEGFYKAFIDIKPKNFAYQVEPVSFIVGNPSSATHGHELITDTTFSKKVDGETVTLKVSTFKVGEPVTLSFDLDQTNLTPYLGAMGHVVILDEYGKEFLHVHPSNEKEPIFQTTFEKPGIYKIWAEFKQNGTVRAFPFVIEIKE
jgi:P-type Cu+ transporter